MKKKVLVLATLLMIAGSLSTYACKCKDPGTVQEAVANTPFVIHGKVVRSESVSFKETINPKKVKAIQENLEDDRRQLFESRIVVKVEVEIIEKFKGAYRKKIVTVFTSESSASCGFSFEEGKEYVIYGSPNTGAYASFLPESKSSKKVGRKNTYWTNLCTRTTNDVSNEVAQLRAIQK